MQSEIEQAREYAHRALTMVGCLCDTRGTNFMGRHGGPIGESGGALVFEASCCKRRVHVTELAANSAVVTSEDGTITVPVTRVQINGADPDAVIDDLFAQHRERLARGEEMQALDVLVVGRMTAAGCTHQQLAPFMSDREEIKYGPAFEGDHYRVVCLVEGCDKHVIVSIDEAISAAPTMMAHHMEDRAAERLERVAAAAKGAESLLEQPAAAAEREFNRNLARAGLVGVRPTFETQLCDDNGQVLLDVHNRLCVLAGVPVYEGAPFTCTGSATIGAGTYACTSKAHQTASAATPDSAPV